MREPYLKNARPDPTFFNRAGKGSQTSFLFREKVFKRYQKCGMKNVTMKLYENDRHEILNETDRATVYEDLYTWIEERI